MSLSAWVYARFSSVEQSKGHSLERQLSTARAYIALKGWQHNPAQEITDEGKSAYSGDNRVEGTALAVFEARAKTGEFRHVPTVLVVENMDRLTRQGYEDALSFCNGLLTSGVSIATTMDGGFLQSGQRIDLATVINLILKAELAFEESAKKSDRIRKAWDAKLDAAKAGDRLAMTPIVPSWLKVDRVTKDISVIPNRSAIVNEIYDAYLDGQSIPKILVMLNTRKEPTWGYRPVVKGWHGATVQKILANRAVLGEYRPSKDSHNGGKFVIGDYFPQVVDTEKFNRVQALRGQRHKLAQGRGGIARHNLFAGVAKCGDCGAPMYCQNSRKAGATAKFKRNGEIKTYTTKNNSYLKCGAARRGYGDCTNKINFRYEKIEKLALKYYLEDALADRVFDNESAMLPHAKAVAEQTRKLDIAHQKMVSQDVV